MYLYRYIPFFILQNRWTSEKTRDTIMMFKIKAAFFIKKLINESRGGTNGELYYCYQA